MMNTCRTTPVGANPLHHLIPFFLACLLTAMPASAKPAADTLSLIEEIGTLKQQPALNKNEQRRLARLEKRLSRRIKACTRLLNRNKNKKKIPDHCSPLSLVTRTTTTPTDNEELATPIAASTQSLAYTPQLLTALQSGPISDINTFGTLPQAGDQLDAGVFTVTIDQSFIAGQASAPSGSTALTGEFVVNANITLTVNGDWDASQPDTQNIIHTAGRVEFDGDTGLVRQYKAASQYYGAPSLVIQATPDNKAFFGLKPGSAAAFEYDKQVYLGSNISGGNVHLNGFSTGYIHDGYDRVTTRDCNMPNVLFTNSGQFQLRYYAGDNGTCDMQNLTILSSTAPMAFLTSGVANSTTQGTAYNLNGLSVDANVGFYTRPEFSMNDWVVRDLEATLPDQVWQNIDSWLLYNVNTLPVGSATTSHVYFRSDQQNPHGFSLAGGSMSSRTIDSVVFDFVNQDVNESGDMYLFDGPGATNETVSITNNVGLKNLNGNQSSTFITFNNSQQNGRQVMLNNNVVYIPAINRAISLNEASLTPTDTVASVQNTIFWGDTGSEGYVAESLNSGSASDILANTAYHHNAVYNGRSDGLFGELHLPLTYTPDAPVTSDNPRFHDDQRRLSTYGSDVLGLNGTAEAAFYAFLTRHLSANDISQLGQMAGHQDYTDHYQGSLNVIDLIDWVQQGFLPTTTTYLTSASGGGTLGLAVTPTFALADSDGDTVDDQFDLCAATPNGESIDANGCSDTQKDDDIDTISNARDICIQTAYGSVVNQQGCSDDDLEGNILGFNSWGIGGGGAMAGYSINPFDDSLRFVGTDMGTAFRSLNGGTNWAPISHFQTTYSSRLGHAAPFGFAGPTVVLHAPEGLHPVRSTNAGSTFTAPSDFPLVYSDDGDASNDERILSWYSDTQNIGTVYAMTNLGLWQSTDAGEHWSFVYNGGAIKGMFIDNEDNGRLYVATSSAVMTSTDGVTYSIWYTPLNHQIHRFTGGSSSDGVTTTITLAYASDESAEAITASIQSGLQSGDVVATYTRPSDAGTETSAGMVYVNTNNTGFVQTTQFVGSHLSMAQNDPNTLYATGSRSWGRDKGTSVYVSDDGGNSWQMCFLQYDWDVNPFAAWDGLLLEHNPVGLNVGWYDAGYYTVGINQLNSAQFGGSGNFFLHATEDSGSHWLDMANEYQGSTPSAPLASDQWSTGGLNVTSVYDIKFHPANHNDIYAAYADIHGLRSTDHGDSWQILPNDLNSIYDYAFDPADANTVFMVNGSQHDWPFRDLSLVGNGGVYQSTNKGSSWQRLTPDNTDYNRQYLSIGYDASRNDLYAGSHSDGISRSLDGGVTWEKFNTGLPTVLPGTSYAMDLVIPQIEVLSNGNVYALVTGVRPELTAAEVTQLGIPQNELIIDTSGGTTQYYSWVNHASTGIYLLDVANGATSWQLLRGSIDLSSHGSWHPDHQPWIRPMAFAIDPNDHTVLWLTDMEPKTYQSNATGVWKSTDNGANWAFVQSHTVGLDIDIAPDDSNYVIAVGPRGWDNSGIFITKDGGQVWELDDRPPLQNNAHSISFDPQDSTKVVYGYFGGGMLHGDRY